MEAVTELSSQTTSDAAATSNPGDSPADDPSAGPPPADDPGASPPPADPWPETVADTIANSVTSVRAIVLRPAARVARRVVYGFVLIVLALLVLVLGLVGLVRLLDTYIPQEVWLTYAVLGGVFTLVGLALWKRRPRGAAA